MEIQVINPDTKLPGGYCAETPEELNNNPDPGEDEPVNVLSPDVLVEGGQSPANAEQGEGHRNVVNLAKYFSPPGKKITEQ